MATRSKARKNGSGMTLAQIDALGRVPAAELDGIAEQVRGAIARAEQAVEASRRAGSPCVSGAGRPEGPPPSNTGGKSVGGPVSARLVLEDGQVKEIPARRGWGGSAGFVDWVNFTVREETFQLVGKYAVTDKDLMILASERLEKVFGFGITAKRETGANFYRESYVLGDGYGMVCHGGQRNTVLVMLNGQGCAAAMEGWEGRLCDFLEGADSPRITRCDVAYDDFLGKDYTVDQAEADFDSGFFNTGGRDPDCQQLGNWKRPNGKGRTFTVGNRANGKFARIYEKGRQLGDKNSEWCRVEVEFKSVDRVIPFDILTRPGEYLAASYPALAWVSERQERILTTQKTVQTNYKKVCDWLKKQCGAALAVVAEMEGGAEQMLALLRRDDIVPAFAKIPDWRLSPAGIHAEPETFAVDMAATVAAW